MKKRGLSLFLALALCLTLLPAAAFANGESETSTLHTHYLCGNGEACSHVGGHNETDKTTFATAITQDNDGYVRVGNDSRRKPIGAHCPKVPTTLPPTSFWSIPSLSRRISPSV